MVGRRSGDSGFRAATPDGKGRYSDAVLNELESQNEDQVGEMSKKVRMLKDVRSPLVLGGCKSRARAF